MERVIQATINALGFLEDGVYYPEPDCFESIRDLIRFLRNDTAMAIARRLCGERNIVRYDLVPIMKSRTTSSKLFDIALRLTINLCQPAALMFHGRYAEDKETWETYQEMERNLKNSKEAFGDVQLFKVFEKKTAAYFAQDWLNRDEETKLVVERIFALTRYILAIGDTDLDKERPPQDLNSHDQLVLAFLDSGFGKLLIKISENSTERDFHLWILEIFAMLLKQHEAKDVAEAGSIHSIEERKRQVIEMQKVVEQEAEKHLNKRRLLSSRHTAFAGSYVLKGLKAINKDNDMVVNRVIKNCTEIDYLNKRKILHRVPKNRRPFDTGNNKHLSALNVRVALRSFCMEMLQKSYSRLMCGCKDSAFSGKRSLGQDKADMHYFILMQFSLEFRRLAELSPEYIKATLSIEAFHHVQTQVDNYLERVRIERKESRIYGLRAQYALAAYKEMLLTLISILKSKNEEWEREIGLVCSHILKVEEYRDLSSCVIRKFVPGILSKTFLRNIILANHAYISLIEKFSKKGILSTVIKRRKMRKRKSRRKEKAEDIIQESRQPDWNLWDDICEELSDVIFGYCEPTVDISAIDVLLNVEDRIHQQFAMLMVQQALHQRRIADAVGIYRSARDLWPIDGIFGTNDMAPEDEFLELRAIYFVDLKEIEQNWKKCRLETYGPEVDNGSSDAVFDTELDDFDDEYEERSDESDAEAHTIEKEVDFRFDNYVAEFARIDVLKWWYIFLLADFESNTAEVNKAILKLLHRVAFDLKMAPRLYQLSLFIIFKRLGLRFKNQSINEIRKSQYLNIYQFGYHLLRRFYVDYRKIGPKLIPELLFWKGPKECYEITNGYGTFVIKEDGTKGKEILWSEELDNELRTLYEEYLLFEEKPENVDIVEYVEQGLSRPRTRRQIIRQMKLLGLRTFGARGTRRNLVGVPKSSVFMPEIIGQIHNLVEEFNSKSPSSRPGDLVNFIRNNLAEKYTRAKIIKQLQYEGIRYELSPKKKRLKQSKKLAGRRKSSEEKVDGLFKGSALLDFGCPDQRDDECEEREKHFRNKKDKSILCRSPNANDGKIPRTNSKESISNGSDVAVGNLSVQEDFKCTDGIIDSEILGHTSSKLSRDAKLDEFPADWEMKNTARDYSDDEIMLGKRDRSALRIASLPDEDNDVILKKARRKRIIASDSE
uniref:Timeless N-terminal domain-containing protein n=1 Tax=Setaria digitata TaxID=48799 RepID=A0A915Q8C5_9BILA